MKYVPDSITGPAIRACGPDWIQINDQTLRSSVIVAAMGTLQAWHVRRFEDLQATDFDRLADLQPEVLLLGCGARLRFAPAALTQGLIARQIGLDCMDTRAACRTYNVLASEGRRVVAALIIESIG